VRAEAVDDNPASPTWVEGPFGDVPLFYTSALITTVDQAQDVADAMLLRKLGLVEGLRFAAIPNPALDVDDVVQVTRLRARVDALHVVEQFNMGLQPSSPMQVTTRKRINV
jgi:hypothetical protein